MDIEAAPGPSPDCTRQIYRVFFKLQSSASFACNNASVLHTYRDIYAPPWVGSRSPDGWEIPSGYRPGGWVLHQPPLSFGFDSQTRGTRENRRTLCESTGFLTGPSPALGGLQIPRWLGSDPLRLSAWWLSLVPATLEFWVRFPNERNQGKQAHPV